MTLAYFQRCEKKYDWQAYLRIGLYYVLRTGDRINFCDLHFTWIPVERPMAGVGEQVERGFFTRPKDAPNQMTRLGRSEEAKERYDLKFQVHKDLELSAGGHARLVRSEKRKTLDVWLFGPLLHEGVACGSLVAELEGLELPKGKHRFQPTDEKTGKPRKTTDPKYNRYVPIFPKSYAAHSKPCKLWVSEYSQGPYPRKPMMAESPPPLVELLDFVRNDVKPAFLPPKVMKVNWKIEDYRGELTECQAYARGG